MRKIIVSIILLSAACSSGCLLQGCLGSKTAKAPAKACQCKDCKCCSACPCCDK